MVKFEFILNEVDSSNLITIINDEKVRALDKAQEYTALAQDRNSRHSVALANASWYAGHAEYLEGLKQKVLAGAHRDY